MCSVTCIAFFCNAVVAAFREVITLYDLEQHLCQLLRVESYDRLQLGPLLRAPIIVQHFNPPSSLLKVPKVPICTLDPYLTSLTLNVTAIVWHLLPLCLLYT